MCIRDDVAQDVFPKFLLHKGLHFRQVHIFADEVRETGKEAVGLRSPVHCSYDFILRIGVVAVESLTNFLTKLTFVDICYEFAPHHGTAPLISQYVSK